MKDNAILFKNIIKEKIIWIPLLFTAICSYGFYITNYAVGLDDTSVVRYYVDGRAPAMGRYSIYMLEWISNVADFSPFILEFMNVIFLSMTAVACIVLFKQILQDTIPMIIYSIFACVFISYPLFNEIFIYYLHGSPGMSLGYLLTVLTTLWTYTYIREQKWKKIQSLFGAIFAIYFAIGIYESFALVYIMLCATTLFLCLVFCDEKFSVKKILTWIGIFIVPIFIAVILRSVTYQMFALISDVPNYMRGMGDLKWIFSSNRNENIRVLFLDYITMYGINAFFYLPIRNYALSMFVFLIYVVIIVVKKKNAWVALGAVGILFAPWLLMPVEGVVTTYRANLGLAFATAFAYMLVFHEVHKWIKWKWIVPLVAGIMIFNQSFDLNHWFYVDHIKYEYQVELSNQIYYELAKNHDLNKPVVFISDEMIPEELASYTHIKYGDKKYQMVEYFQNIFGNKMPERFFDDVGYLYVEVPNLWFYTWGQNAFEEGPVEISKFYSTLGYEIIPGTTGNYQEAKIVNADMPGFPKDGSIIELDKYIVVKLSD
jgi:hypothetical protein